ncbi:polysaccharide deacetylase family protein [Mariniphaga sp.]|uniref:polysaccharide deacetylase family protein n=1 Tax=Mariniphaga sp. TaxID=1954475 RepID=UPI003564F189
MKILTFDIEEWFHILDNESTKTINEWKNYEVRIHQNMDRIFNILERTNTKATFFCLGWIAETYPEVVKEIVSRGYEVGTHARMHQLVYEQTPAEFEKDLEYSIKTLEDITGQKVKYFRAPGFSITENEKWAFEILVKHGIEVDSSIFPAPRAHGGFPSYKQPIPSILKYNGIELKELPINYSILAGKSIIFSGGGYFRLFPYALIKKWTKQSDYVMSYLHPRDFDAEQPVIKELSVFRKFKSYVGLKGATAKLEKWLSDFEFVDIGTAVKNIEWDKVPLVEL